MRFALIGDHPDGLAMAQALLATGRYQLEAYAGPPEGAAEMRRRGWTFAPVREVEEVLARRDVELVLVADELTHRPEVLRRAVQSEKHVLCVHPADLLPDIAYEVAMIQKDTGKAMLPLLPERLHPGLIRLRERCQQGLVGKLQALEYERAFTGRSSWEASPLLRCWDGLRYFGGEIAEISALATSLEDLQPGDQVTLTGRFEQGGLFQAALQPSASDQRCRLLVRGDTGEAELLWSEGVHGPAELRAGGQVERWDAWDPWQSLVAAFEATVAGAASSLTWLDGIRCLELFDATRRSVHRRRVVPLHYEEFTEVSSFKGVMTGLGCLLLTVAAVLFIVGASMNFPRSYLYGLVGCLAVFLLLQALRLIVPEEMPEERKEPVPPKARKA